MSLVSELGKSSSWVNRYFKQRFNRVIEFTGIEGPAIKALETKVPTETQGIVTARIGTAFEHRIMMTLGMRPVESAIVVSGIEALATNNPGIFRNDRGRIRWVISVMRLFSTRDDPYDDEMAARMAVLVAHLDAGLRSGGLWSEELAAASRGPLRGDLEVRLLGVASAEEVAEVVGLMQIARGALPLGGNAPASLEPIFEGSRYVGGAEADLIIDGCLLDIRTTSAPREKLPASVRQLIGYALLDWNNDYGIREAGFYFSRQGTVVSWPLDDLISRTATDSKILLSELRGEFKELATGSRMERRTTE